VIDRARDFYRVDRKLDISMLPLILRRLV
jgi:hypothetical protein